MLDENNGSVSADTFIITSQSHVLVAITLHVFAIMVSQRESSSQSKDHPSLILKKSPTITFEGKSPVE
jgi:hypothetical protein